MNEKKNSDLLFRLDCSMALHQRAVWVLLLLAAILGALICYRFLPAEHSTVGSFILLMLLVFVYRWASAAPKRALTAWQKRTQENPALRQDMYNFVLELEKALPFAQRKEMNFSLTGWKAALLSSLGKKEEALSLLRSFDQYWDESQKKMFQDMIQKISGESADAEQKEKE